MANELTISVSLDYEDSRFQTDGLSVEQIIKTVSSKKKVRHTQSIGTSEEAIALGEITSPGYAIFRNLDPTNFVNLKVATGGAIFARLDPDTNADGKGGVALLRLGSGAQAPYAAADTASCDIEYIIVSS